MSDHKQSRLEKFLEIIQKNSRFFIPLITLLWLIRIYEFYFVELIGEDFPKFSYLPSGIFLDVLISILLFGLSIFIQLILHMIRIKRNFVFPLFSIIFLLLNIGLIHYFRIAKSPLDETIFFFSWEEIVMISNSNKISIFVFVSFFILLGLYGVLTFVTRKLFFSQRGSMALFFIVIFCLFFVNFSFYRSEKKLAEVYVNNRAIYFFGKSIEHLSKEKYNDEYEVINSSSFANLNPNVFASEVTDEDFPLLHELNDSSEFASYFNRSKHSTPSFVFIIVEALSSDFIGEMSCKTGNAMPFLDSLSKKSLYFPNFLSVCQNTFNVLPASLSSLPNSSDGEYTMMNEFIPQMSIPSILKNYYSRFFCGVDLGFTNMDGYMKSIQTDYLVRDWEVKFNQTFSKQKNLWGYPDGFLFDKTWLDFKKQKLQNRPRFDVILTISTHEPYSFPNDEKYIGQNIKKKNDVGITKRNLKHLYSNDYLMASYTYLDDELRKYFRKAKNQGQFENTIFFIYGDHGCPSYSENAISRFNVPLVIYSPLLKKSKKIESVSTHLDIAPTILNYLRLEYKLDIPKKVSFLGKELDFFEKFRNSRTVALLSVNGKNEAFLDRNFLMANGNLYQVNKGLNLRKINNPLKESKLKSQIVDYDNFSKYCFTQKKILPEYLFNLFNKSIKYNVIYNEILNFDNGYTKNERVYLNSKVKINPKSTSIKVTSELECYLTSKKQLHSISKIIAALGNVKKDGVEFVFWRQTSFSLVNAFKPNSYNKIKIFIEIDLINHPKLKKENEFLMFISNEQKYKMRIKNIKTLIYTTKKRLHS